MKSKFKGNGKNRILAVIASAVMFCLVVLLVIVTRKTDAVADTVIINGKEYSNEDGKRMQILEILPDESFDELGWMIGNDQGTYSWNLIQKMSKNYSKYSSDGKWSTFLSEYMDYYINYMNAILKSTNYRMGYKYGNTIYQDDNSMISALGNASDLSGVSLIACYYDSQNDTYKQLREGNTDVRDIFSYMVFGNASMEGKVELVVKSANDVTKEDVESAGLVYISGQVHDTTLQNYYVKYYAKEYNKEFKVHTKANDKSTIWKFGTDSTCVDLKADVALDLYIKNCTEAKPIIYNSTDKGIDENGRYTNISRICNMICSIERNQFIESFATDKDVNVDGYVYKGMHGGIKLENENGCQTFNIYVNGNKNTSWVDTLSYNDEYKKLIEYTSPVGTYPLYTNQQSRLDKYSYEFNSNNMMTSTMFSADLTNDIKDTTTVNEKEYSIGNTTKEALTLTKDNDKSSSKLNSVKAIEYIIGAYKRTPSDSINVLEIEPIGVYGYDTDSAKNSIKTWFGLKEDSAIDVNVKSVSVNAFISLNEDILAKYDLVIIGNSGSLVTNNDVFGSHMYNKDRSFTITKKKKTVTYDLNANDLTQKAYDKLFEFAKKGMPIALEKNIYYGNTSVVDKGTNMYKMKKTQLASQIADSGCPNIVSVDNYIASDVLNYIYKPTSTISPAMTEYDGTQASLNSRDKLKSLNFSGTVTVPESSHNYSVKIYIDRNCDSMFSEDHTSDDTELFYCNDDGSGKEWSSSSFSVNISLPSGLTGYVGWKAEVTDTVTGIRTYTSGAFALKSEQPKTIKVLQIKHDSAHENLNIMPGSTFAKAFDKITDITGFTLDVKQMTKSEFSKEIGKNSKLLDDYSMIVMGFSDNYGNDNKLNDAAIDAIKAYIKDGKSVLMTHDSMSYRKNGNGDDEAGSFSNLNKATQILKPLIGMKKDYSLTDTLAYKLASASPFAGVNGDGNTKTTQKLSKLNTGEITSYPYAIDSEINVAETHAQYFALDMDAQVNGSEPVVWYTLDGGADNYFTLSGQDAVNNYYIYSAGNVTYTSAGHSDMDEKGTLAEMELFVNTFVRAILAGNSAPQVTYTDAVLDDTVKEYSSYIKYNYTKFADRKLNFNFTISDADLIDGRGIINEAFMYVYNEEARGDSDAKDGKFDASKDKRLGYISVDSSGEAVLTAMPSSTASKPRSSVEYTVDNFWELLGAEDAALRQKLADGTLKIGIQATDSHNGVGYAILNLQVKDLFNMD